MKLQFQAADCEKCQTGEPLTTKRKTELRCRENPCVDVALRVSKQANTFAIDSLGGHSKNRSRSNQVYERNCPLIM